MGWEHPDDRERREELEEWEDKHGPVGVGWPAEHVREDDEELHAAMLDIHAGDVPLVTGVFEVHEVYVWPDDVELPGLAPVRWLMGGGF